jgi:hypothetical protein
VHRGAPSAADGKRNVRSFATITDVRLGVLRSPSRGL